MSRKLSIRRGGITFAEALTLPLKLFERNVYSSTSWIVVHASRAPEVVFTYASPATIQTAWRTNRPGRLWSNTGAGVNRRGRVRSMKRTARTGRTWTVTGFGVIDPRENMQNARRRVPRLLAPELSALSARPLKTDFHIVYYKLEELRLQLHFVQRRPVRVNLWHANIYANSNIYRSRYASVPLFRITATQCVIISASVGNWNYNLKNLRWSNGELNSCIIDVQWLA